MNGKGKSGLGDLVKRDGVLQIDDVNMGFVIFNNAKPIFRAVLPKIKSVQDGD